MIILKVRYKFREEFPFVWPNFGNNQMADNIEIEAYKLVEQF